MTSLTKARCSLRVKSEAGFSLIEILMSLTLIGISMAAMISMIIYQNSAIKQVESKLAVLDLERYMIMTLSNSSICSFALTNPVPLTFDSTSTSASMNISRIQTSATASAPDVVSVGGTVSSVTTVKSIQVTDIENTGASDDFRGQLVVAFTSSSGIQFKPLKFAINIKTDPDPVTSPATAKKVISCNASQASPVASGIQVFHSSDYFIVPKGITSVTVTVQGAGGGGSGHLNGGGGGGGGVTSGTVTVTPGTQVQVQVGAGGAGGHFVVFGAFDAADPGGASAFGSSLSCSGGGGGLNSGAPGAGGTCTGGTPIAGSAGTSTSGGSGKGLGAGAGGAIGGACSNGQPGQNVGGGGGGAGYLSGCSEIWGGAGAPGRVIVEW